MTKHLNFSRQACAIESAAKLNPNRDIYVLFTTPVGSVTSESELPVIGAMNKYPNIYLRNVNIYNFSKGTPAEQWIMEDRIISSSSFIFHISDYLRLVTLYKYGGSYFDTDFIFIRSIDNLPSTFIASTGPLKSNQEPDPLNGALGFDSKGVGHKIAEMVLRYFSKYI